MKSTTRRRSVTTSVLMIALLLAAGIVLCGCSPGPPKPTGPGGGSGAQPSGPPSTPKPAVTEEEGAKPEQTTEAAQPASEAAAELDLAPAVSTYAPAEDLAAQVAEYIEDLEEAVESEEEYNDSVDKIAKQSNTLILIALALGLHDTDNPFKAAAPAMVKAAQELAGAGDYAAAKAGVEAVKAATTSTEGDPASLKWDKLASLPELMEAVPLINTRLKRYVRDGREEKAKKAAKDLAGYSAVLAVIAQGSIANSGDTEKPDKVGEWQGFCVQMRDAAAAVNAAVGTFGQEGSSDAFEAAKAAMKDLAQSCDDCHAVFHPDVDMSSVPDE